MTNRQRVSQFLKAAVVVTFLQLLIATLVGIPMETVSTLQVAFVSIMLSTVSVFIMPPAFGFARVCVNTKKYQQEK